MIISEDLLSTGAIMGCNHDIVLKTADGYRIACIHARHQITENQFIADNLLGFYIYIWWYTRPHTQGEKVSRQKIRTEKACGLCWTIYQGWFSWKIYQILMTHFRYQPESSFIMILWDIVRRKEINITAKEHYFVWSEIRNLSPTFFTWLAAKSAAVVVSPRINMRLFTFRRRYPPGVNVFTLLSLRSTN